MLRIGITFACTGGFAVPGPYTRVTVAPLSSAFCAMAIPIFPELGFVIYLNASRYALVGPAVISMCLPARSWGRVSLSITDWTISVVPGIFALPSSNLGKSTLMPICWSLVMFSLTIWCLYIDACIAGAMITGMLAPIPVVSVVVTGVSSIPDATFPMVFAVDGATSMRSACWSCSPA